MGEVWGVHGVALPLVTWEPLACPHLSLCGQGLHTAGGSPQDAHVSVCTCVPVGDASRLSIWAHF